MHPRRLIRELQFDGHGEKGTFARIGNVSFVCISFGGLNKETHIGGAAKGVIGGADSFGHDGDDLLFRALFLLRNGDGFRLYR